MDSHRNIKQEWNKRDEQDKPLWISLTLPNWCEMASASSDLGFVMESSPLNDFCRHFGEPLDNVIWYDSWWFMMIHDLWSFLILTNFDSCLVWEIGAELFGAALQQHHVDETLSVVVIAPSLLVKFQATHYLDLFRTRRLVITPWLTRSYMTWKQNVSEKYIYKNI